MAPSRPNRKSVTSRVDARHALRLVEVMDGETTPPATTPSRAQVKPVADAPSRGGEPPKAAGRRPKSAPKTSPDVELWEDARTEITALTPEEGGVVTMVSLAAYVSSEGQGQQRYTLRLLTASCESLALKVGEVSAQTVKDIREAVQMYLAVLKSMELLGYGSMSRRRLAQKLRSRGFAAEVSLYAVDYMAERGYLDESDTAARFARRGVAKLWGPRRIKDDLFARGFTADVIEDTLADLEDVDFAENCLQVIQKKYGGVPKEQAARRKLAAALMRLGYTSEHISEAVKLYAK